MAIGPDRVQVIKQESAALGGDSADDVTYPAPISAQEDAIECAGVYFQDAGNRDENVYIARDAGRVVLKEVSNPESAIVSEIAHGKLRQLVHLASGGPYEGWASLSYRETLPSADPFPTSVIWWTSAAKTHKIVQKLITYNANKTPATIQWTAFASDGTTAISQMTDAISYSSVFETTRTRTVNI